MKKISAKDLCWRDVGRCVYLDGDCRSYGKVVGLFVSEESVVVVTDHPVAAVGVLVLNGEGFVQMVEKDDFVLVGVAG